MVGTHARQLTGVALVLAVAAACTGGGSGAGGSGKPAFPASPVSWIAGKAEAANGAAPGFTVTSACGSPTDTYLAELLHTAPTDAKVLHEWGDIVPGGKQLLISGKVTHAHLGPYDLPMSHPYGYDLSLDVALDPPFLPFAKNLGPVPVPDVEMHVEVASGLIPHGAPSSGAAPGATWAAQSDINMTGFLPGFDLPAVGDPIVVMGRWVIDCGHDNFQTELHPASFMAWSHQDGDTTVVRTFSNPYRDTETYSPDASILGHVEDASRFKRPDAKPFPPYLTAQVFGLAFSGADRLHSQELIEATHASPPPFAVCAPGGGGSGAGSVKPAVSYDLVTRPGVSVKVAPEKGFDCATVTVTMGSDYKARDATLRQCPLPWSYMTDVARQALGGDVDIKGLLDRNVPPTLLPKVSNDPDTTCADALVGPAVDAATTTGRSRTDGEQPFPVVGVIKVGRAP